MYKFMVVDGLMLLTVNLEFINYKAIKNMYISHKSNVLQTVHETEWQCRRIVKGLNKSEYWTWLASVTSGAEIVSPIHTSSHYQTFETPFLHELVGGDRNMEQTNLVVTPDGQTWDEVTRDVSYIGNCVLVAEADGPSYTPASAGIFDEWRGKTNERNLFNKDFAIAYDRQICLRDGQYIVAFRSHIDTGISGSQWGYIKVNGGNAVAFYNVDASYSNAGGESIVQLKRGDYIQIFSMLTHHTEAFYHIYRI